MTFRELDLAYRHKNCLTYNNGFKDYDKFFSIFNLFTLELTDLL